jgi:general secretion pathway protein M
VRPPLARIAALAILAALVAAFLIGPVAAYCELIGSNAAVLATKNALLQRYRALAAAPNAAAPADAPPIYPKMPESQASALLQETVKTTAAAARIQVLGLQVLRSESVSGATRVGVRVRASGDMASLRALIYAIETARPVLYPDNLQIQSHATAADAAPRPLDFQLDIAAFKAEPAS